MTPDKAQQLGNDLACMAATLAEIAEELKAMYDFDHDHDDAKTVQPEAPKPPTLEDVRGILADKSRLGHTDAIREIILRQGSTRLTDVDPAKYATILDEVRRLE